MVDKICIFWNTNTLLIAETWCVMADIIFITEGRITKLSLLSLEHMSVCHLDKQCRGKFSESECKNIHKPDQRHSTKRFEWREIGTLVFRLYLTYHAARARSKTTKTMFRRLEKRTQRGYNTCGSRHISLRCDEFDVCVFSPWGRCVNKHFHRLFLSRFRDDLFFPRQ